MKLSMVIRLVACSLFVDALYLASVQVATAQEAASFAKLCAAITNNDVATVRTMLNANSNLVDMRDTTGATPLHYAAKYGRVEISKLLLDEGAEVNPESGNRAVRYTPLSLAVRNGHTDIVKLLLSQGALPNPMEDGRRTTLLHWVATEGKADMMKALLAGGADTELKDSDGKTPLDRALETGQKEIVQLLRTGGSEASDQGAAQTQTPRSTAQPSQQVQAVDGEAIFFGVTLGDSANGFLEKCQRAGIKPQDYDALLTGYSFDTLTIFGALNGDRNVSQTRVMFHRGMIYQVEVQIHEVSMKPAEVLAGLANKYGFTQQANGVKGTVRFRNQTVDIFGHSVSAGASGTAYIYYIWKEAADERRAQAEQRKRQIEAEKYQQKRQTIDGM